MAVLRLRVVWLIVHTLAVVDRLVYRSGCRPARDERVPGQSGQSGGRAAVRVRVPARTKRGTHGVPCAAVVGTTSLPWPLRGRPVAPPTSCPQHRGRPCVSCVVPHRRPYHSRCVGARPSAAAAASSAVEALPCQVRPGACCSGAPTIAAAWALGPVPQLQPARRWRHCPAKYVQVRAAAAPLP
jgi:hypothetical protein